MTGASEETGRARYCSLQRLARQQGRDTPELLTLYALEGLLARLAASDHREQLVVMGGMLLAAFAQRCPTRDLDVHAQQLESDVDKVQDLTARDRTAAVKVAAAAAPCWGRTWAYLCEVNASLA